MERPRAHSVAESKSSQFHIQATRFFQKLSSFSRRRKGSVGQDPYQFTPRPTRSLDVTAKPFMSQPALGLHISDSSPDNDGSSYSASPNPPSPSSRHNHSIAFPPVIDVGPSLADLTSSGSASALITSSPTLSLSNLSAPPPVNSVTSSRFPNFHFTGPSNPSGRSVSFDVPRELLTTKPTGGIAPGVSNLVSKKRSFEFRRAVLNKNAGNDLPNQSTPPRKLVPSCPSVLEASGWSSVVDASGAPKIEGLPSSSLAGAMDISWWKQSYRSKDVGTKQRNSLQAASRERAVTLASSSVVLQQPIEAPSTPSSPNVLSTPITPPSYELAVNWPPGQTDSPNAPPFRSALLRLSSLPPSVFRMEGGSARLSPSVITRHHPLPLMSLPTLPVADGSTQASGSGSQVRLRSMPALPMEGTHDEGFDQENGNSDDEDEDNNMDDEIVERTGTPMNPGSEDEGDGDEDDDNGTTETDSPAAVTRPSSYAQQMDSPPIVNPRPISIYTTPGEITPVAKPGIDYFSSGPQQAKHAGPLLTPLEWDTELKRRISALESPRPSRSDLSMYRQSSKSMVDLLSTKNRDMPTIVEEIKGKGKAKDTTPIADQSADGADPEARGSRLRRQRSLPMFTESSDPPPYPVFEKHRWPFIVQPREEEGKEKLPAYTNSIYLSAILPRKVEFSAPGVQSKDRKWRRSLCILEGTALRIFNPPPGTTGVSALGSWWERKVGVGDLTSTAPPRPSKRLPGPVKREEEQEHPPEVDVIHESPGIPVPKKKRSFASGFLTRSRIESGTSSRRQSIDTPRDEGGNRMRQSFSISRPNLTGTSASSSTSHSNDAASGTSAITQPISRISSLDARTFPSGSGSHHMAECFNPDPKDLVRVYTSQRAESGLASDYLKRKNVIRVRMEGEQFLLQAPNVPSVVEWIEGFQSAANVALDLEDRPMPKVPVFPRRRRRRTRPPEPTGGT